MKPQSLYLVLLCIVLLGAKSKADISPKDILSEKYPNNFFPEQFEYTLHVEKYKKAVADRQHIYKQTDSLFTLETLSLWPLEEQRKYKHIIDLTKNNQSGDVYTYLEELGPDYAITLNKVISLNEIYNQERNIIKINQQITALEEWAAKVAAIVHYFYEDFMNKTLDKDMDFYVYILGIEKEIQELQQLQTNDAAAFLLKNEKKAHDVYFRWKSVRMREQIKSSPQRDFLFIQLEQKFKNN